MRVSDAVSSPSLLLRRFVARDAERVLALNSEEGARAWLPSQVYADHAEALAALEFLIGQYASPGDPRRGPYVLAVEHRADSVLIGHVGFSPLEGDVEIGCAIAEDYQGRGFAAEAIVAATRWVFRRFALERILGITAKANTASRRAIARAGFVHQEDKTMCFQGTEQEVCVYALSRSDGLETGRRPG